MEEDAEKRTKRSKEGQRTRKGARERVVERVAQSRLAEREKVRVVEVTMATTVNQMDPHALRACLP